MLGEMRGAGMGNTTKMNDTYSYIHLCLYVCIMHIICRYTDHMYLLHIYSAIRTEDTTKHTYMQCIDFPIESWSWITYTPIYSHDTYIMYMYKTYIVLKKKRFRGRALGDEKSIYTRIWMILNTPCSDENVTSLPLRRVDSRCFLWWWQRCLNGGWERQWEVAWELDISDPQS